MKPIFIAGATLLAASSAFGFAKAVDYFARDPAVLTPTLPIHAERNLPDTGPGWSGILPADTAGIIAPLPPSQTAAITPALPTGDVAGQAGLPRDLAALETGAAGDFAAQPNFLLPADGPADAAYPQRGAPFAAIPPTDRTTVAQRYQFQTLPMLGVYR